MTATVQALDARQFRNALGILDSLDFDELFDSGVLGGMSLNQYRTFREDPFGWAIRADNAQIEALYNLIAARMP